ncbi:MAG TPA: hypothetical protein VFS21_25575 [Roseiflexaceae bacterium]|nr:hypothetical protein [Roseiflexaceae bacterium]
MHTLPFTELYCPHPTTVNPFAQRADQQTLDWALSRQLISETDTNLFGAARFGLLAGCLAPKASFTTLRLLADWCAWAVLWDDVCDRPDMHASPLRVGSQQQLFVTILREGAASPRNQPLAGALLDLRRRLLQRAAPGILEPFTAAVELFFAGCWAEVQNRAQQTVPPPARYLALRRASSGMDSALHLAALLEGCLPGAAVRRHPAIARLHRLATEAVCIANDLISLPKELACGETHNLVVGLQRSQGLPLADAFARGVEQHNATVRAFLWHAKQRPTFGRDERVLERYLELLRSFMSGNLAWSALTNRYCVPVGLDVAMPSLRRTPEALRVPPRRCRQHSAESDVCYVRCG